MMLVDTNIFVDYLRGYAPAVEFFESKLHIISNEVLFSAITETELVVGKDNTDATKREKLLHFLYSWNKVEVNNRIAVLAGDICRNYGLTIPDGIIAATAILNGAELITKNVKDFRRVQNLKVRSPY